ncbi:unnamed protein product [Pedinophyceae sp. YPF-701]|nr:unnamed protein product [Pedinophyceae sp. YPF-701]
MESSSMSLGPDAGQPSPANGQQHPAVASPDRARGGPRAPDLTDEASSQACGGEEARGGRKSDRESTWTAQDLLAALQSDLGEVDLNGCTVDIGRDGLCLTTGYWTLVNGTIRGGTLALAAGVRNVAFRRVTFAGPGGSAATRTLKTEAEQKEAMRHGVVEVAGARNVSFEECIFGGDLDDQVARVNADIARTGEFCTWLPGLSVHGSSTVRVCKSAICAQLGPGLYASGRKCRVLVTDRSSFMRNVTGALAEDGAVLHLSEVVADTNFESGVSAVGAVLKARLVLCNDNQLSGIAVTGGSTATLDRCVLHNNTMAGLVVEHGGSNVMATGLRCTQICRAAGDDGPLGLAVGDDATCTLQGGELGVFRACEVRAGGVVTMTDVSVTSPGAKARAIGPVARDGGRLCLTRVKIRGVENAFAALGRGSVVVAEAVECHNVGSGAFAGYKRPARGGTAELRDCVFDGCGVALAADGGGHVRSENAKIAGCKVCARAIAEGRVDVRGGEVWCDASATRFTKLEAEGKRAKVTATDVTWTGGGLPDTRVTGGAEVVVTPCVEAGA